MPVMEKRRTLRKNIRRFLIGLLLWLAALAAGYILGAGGYLTPVEDAPKLDVVMLEERLAESSELASVTYSYTNVAQFESSNNLYGIKIPFTTKRFTLAYDGIIKAGVDLGETVVTVTGKSIRVMLPRAKTLSHEIDESSIGMYDEKDSIFNPVTVSDFKSFQREQKSIMEAKALDGGLLNQAQEQAAICVEALLRDTLPDGYTLTVQ